jgi:hypothetical protein
MDDITAFGNVGERKSAGPGRPIQEYILNDEQAMMLVLLLPTNKTTARAKADAVKIFAESRRLLFKETSE